MSKKHRKTNIYLLIGAIMEELLKLLNEYDGTPTEWKQIGDKIYFDGLGGNSELHELIIISKYYGFIHRLVENDKIDFDIVKADTTRPIRDNMNKYTLEDYTRYERVLMLLSIQDNPIEFLISILK